MINGFVYLILINYVIIDMFDSILALMLLAP